MNKQIIITIGIVTLAILALMAWGYDRTAGPVQSSSSQTSTLVQKETMYDFGTISMAKGKVNHMFEITNPTDRDITINNLQTSCMCTSAYLVNGSAKEGPFGMPGMGGMTATQYVIPAGATRAVEAVYDPAAHGPAGVGAIDRFIELAEANGGTLRFEIKAMVTP